MLATAKTLFDLNPSVKAHDEARLHKHLVGLKNLFEARERMGVLVSNIDIVECAKNQYQARLFELRRWFIKNRGKCVDRLKTAELKDFGMSDFQIHEARRRGIYYYRLVPLAQSTFYQARKARLDLEI